MNDEEEEKGKVTNIIEGSLCYISNWSCAEHR